MSLNRKTKTIIKKVKSANSVSRQHKGSVAARRFVVTDVVKVIDVPDRVDKVYIKNIGQNNVLINFNNDNATNYIELATGETTPGFIDIGDGVKINLVTAGGNTRVECIFTG